MKKLFCLLLVLMLFPVASLAEADFSQFSLEELDIIRRSASKEILKRSQWGEVTVPPGHYVVGEDIPEGHWTIRYTPGTYCLIEYFKDADESGIEPADVLKDYNSWAIGDPGSDMATLYDKTEIDLQLISGYHLKTNYSDCVFVPFTGRKSPFFD